MTTQEEQDGVQGPWDFLKTTLEKVLGDSLTRFRSKAGFHSNIEILNRFLLYCVTYCHIISVCSHIFVVKN